MPPGEGRPVTGVVKVKGTVLEGAGADGLVTVTPTGTGNAASAAEIAAVSCVALTKVVARGEPFQLTAEPFTKFVPFTVSVKPLGWQYGAEANAGAEINVIVGAGPCGRLIVNLTTFDNSVVVVAPVLEVGETDEPGIWMATGTSTGEVVVVGKLEAGTTAVITVPV
jgi:hypothetical protein